MESMPPSELDQILLDSNFVRRLARALVRDPDQAEDLAQDALVVALERPPGDGSNVRGWIATVVRRLAIDRARKASARTRHEAQTVSLEPAPGADDIVARIDLSHRVSQALRELEEPYRTALFLRYVEELEPATIAVRLDVPIATVKTCLRRGLELLRTRFDREWGTRAAWSTLLVPLTIDHTQAALGAGVIAMSTTLKIVAAACLCVAGTWMLWPSSQTLSPLGAPATAHSSPSELAAPRAEDPARRSVPNSAASSERTTITSPETHPRRWIVRGHVTGEPNDRAVGAKLSATFTGRYNITDFVEAYPAADNSYEIDVSAIVSRWLRDAEPAYLVVSADHPTCLLMERRVPFSAGRLESADPDAACTEFVCDLNLTPAAVIEGRVSVPKDWESWVGCAPKPRVAHVALLDVPSDPSRSVVVVDEADCDKEGRWTLRSARAGRFTVLACAEELRPTAIVTELAFRRSIGVPAIELQRGASISGIVMRKGRPIGAGATVVGQLVQRQYVDVWLSKWMSRRSNLLAANGGFEYRLVSASTLADGSFRLDGLAPAEYEVSIEDQGLSRMILGGRRAKAQSIQAPQSAVVLTGVAPEIQLKLEIGGRPTTDAELAGVTLDLVSLDPNTPSGGQIELTNTGSSYGPIQVNPGVAYELRMPGGRYAPFVLKIDALELDEQRTITLSLSPSDQAATLVIRIVTPNSEALASVQIGMNNAAAVAKEQVKWTTVQRAPDGTFVLRDQPPGSYRVHVRTFDPFDEMPSHFIDNEFEVELFPKAKLERVVQLELGGCLRLAAKDDRGSFVRAAVVLRNSAGTKLATEFYSHNQAGVFGCGWYLCELGINDHPALPAGRYEIELTADGFTSQTAVFDLRAGGTETREFVLQRR